MSKHTIRDHLFSAIQILGEKKKIPRNDLIHLTLGEGGKDWLSKRESLDVLEVQCRRHYGTGKSVELRNRGKKGRLVTKCLTNALAEWQETGNPVCAGFEVLIFKTYAYLTPHFFNQDKETGEYYDTELFSTPIESRGVFILWDGEETKRRLEEADYDINKKYGGLICLFHQDNIHFMRWRDSLFTGRYEWSYVKTVTV